MAAMWIDEDGYEWDKPNSHERLGTEENKSCWDCKNLTVGRGFGRVCILHKGKWIASPQNGDEEKKEWGDTVANQCPDYDFDDDRISNAKMT